MGERSVRTGLDAVTVEKVRWAVRFGDLRRPAAAYLPCDSVLRCAIAAARSARGIPAALLSAAKSSR